MIRAATILILCFATLSLPAIRPWVPPRDAQQAALNSDEYAWRLFVALNWPANAALSAADPRSALGADRPVVWETWENVADVYLEAGRDPGPWTAYDANPDQVAERRFELPSLGDLSSTRHIVNGRMVPLGGPLAGARRLTEIRMNQTAYAYIRQRELYNVEGQTRAALDARGVQFPLGSIEVKAKWRPIGADERSRYHSIEVRFADGSSRLYGLTALHVVSKDLPQWFWATFEHVDNRSLPDSDGWQLPSRDRFACPVDHTDCNRVPRGLGLEGTVWEHYRLRGTMTSFVDSAARPLRLANSELEPGFQTSSSCPTCHSRSTIGVEDGRVTRLSIFEHPGRGSLGVPRSAWFEGNGTQPAMRSLDFVWSLSKAQSKQAPR